MATALKQYSLAEVAKHNTAADLWMVIDDKVYDVTKFQTEHPGGEEVLIDSAGKDATTDFVDVGHSTDAKEQMKQFVVGEIIEAERKKKKTSVPEYQRMAIIAGSALAAGIGLVLIYRALKK